MENVIKDYNEIIKDYPFDEDNPFLFDVPVEEIIYEKEDLINHEDE